MCTKHDILLSFSVLILLFVSLPGVTLAGTLTVSNSCGAAPNCFSSISAAISAASNTTSPSIVIEPGTYTESVTLTVDNLPISGTETARTILQSASGPAITANNLGSVNISKLTIVSTSVGIQITGVSSATISNNIFFGSGQGTAILFQGTSSSGTVSNNTFLLNQTAISSPPTGINIQSNIFSRNSTALSAALTTNISYNDFDKNTNNGYQFLPSGETNLPNTVVSATNPIFVNPNSPPPSMDLHLQQGSPCIGTGFSGTDIGAYGGTGADTIPFIISGVTLTEPSSGSVSVSWSPNIAYNIGGYNVYYSLNRSGAPYDTKATLASSVTNTVITGLTTSTTPPSAPVLNNLGIGNGTLFVSWSAVPAATLYNLHYTDTSIVSSATITIPVVNTTSYTLGGLINGHNYLVTVSAVAQDTYFFSVTAFTTGGGTPGVSDESNYSTEQSISLGSSAESPPSNSQTDFPEALVPNPNLVNNDCFIATAAYGHYSASQVQALREFRDRYLLTNAPGRAFIRWYYRYGPVGAEFINAHPWLKPAVRMALMPAVGGALFMTRASAPVKAVTLVSAGLLILSLLARKKLLHAGGRR